MPKAQKTNDNWNVSYYCREASTSEDIINLSMSWENRDVDTVQKNLNTWLTAIGINLEVVVKK